MHLGNLHSRHRKIDLKNNVYKKKKEILFYSYLVAKSGLTLWTIAHCPAAFPGKNTGVGCHFLLQRIFLTQGSKLILPYCRQNSLPLSHKGSPQPTPGDIKKRERKEGERIRRYGMSRKEDCVVSITLGLLRR